jgi:hypothetical protein
MWPLLLFAEGLVFLTHISIHSDRASPNIDTPYLRDQATQLLVYPILNSLQRGTTECATAGTLVGTWNVLLIQHASQLGNAVFLL